MFQSQLSFIPFDFRNQGSPFKTVTPQTKSCPSIKSGPFLSVCAPTTCPPVNPSRPALVGQIVVTCVVNLFFTPHWQKHPILTLFFSCSHAIICHPLVLNRDCRRRKKKKFILSQLPVSHLITCFFLVFFNLLQEWKPSCPSSLTTRPRRSTSSSWFGSPTSTMRCAVTRPSPNVTGWGECGFALLSFPRGH